MGAAEHLIISTMHKTSPQLFPKLESYCKELEHNFNSISEERKGELQSLSKYLTSKWGKNETPKVIVICTHNSRRSHLGQLWLAVGAEYFNLPAIETFSGGTEATAFHPNAISTLQRVGFKIDTTQADLKNPAYEITWADTMNSYTAISSKFDTAPNPTKDFAAIMVCSEADKGCPFVPGSDFRLSLPFEDPKTFDGTDLQDAKYDERSLQIGTELFYALSQIKL